MRHWFKMFIFFSMLGLLVYFNCLNNKFLMDDYIFLRDPFLSHMQFIPFQWNPYGRQVLGILDQGGAFPYYRPLTHTLYDLCYPAFKNNFWQYHSLNLFLFVIAATLIYWLILKISGNYYLAFLTSLFYLLHPINGIVVNYISANVFSLQVIFMLGAILLLWESLDRRDNRVLYWLSLLFSLLSLFWHESAIMFPFYISAVFLLFREGPFQKKMLYLIPYFLIVISYMFFRSFFLNIDGLLLKQIFHSPIPVSERLASLFQVFSWYITRLLYPQGIVLFWVPPALHGHLFWNNLGLVSLLLLFILLFIRFSKEKICQLAIIWFLAGFVPVCVAAFRTRNGGVFIEPHWFIFSSIGFFILFAYFFLIILNRAQKFGLVLLFFVIFVWGWTCHEYNQLWSDEKTYARFWSLQTPHLQFPYFYWAEGYENEGNYKEAIKYYHLALNNGFDAYTQKACVHLGKIYLENGDWAAAESYLRMSLKINSFSADGYEGLGELYLKQGQRQKAEKYFLLALTYNPLMLESRNGLASISLSRSEYQKAIELCRKNLDIVSDDTNTLFLLIDIYIHKKETDHIKEYAYRIIHHESDPEILTRLGVIMAQNNIADLALDSFMKALRIAPEYKETYLDIGIFLGNIGKYDEAIRFWKLGSGLDPSDQRFKNNIAKAIKFDSKGNF